MKNYPLAFDIAQALYDKEYLDVTLDHKPFDSPEIQRFREIITAIENELDGAEVVSGVEFEV